MQKCQMSKVRLKQYLALKREAPKLKKDIDKLYTRLDNVPTVSGKVQKSGDDFPYIEEHLTVEMDEPVVATEIKKQIRIKEKRLEDVEMETTVIDQFIAGIEDSTDRQIFELSFINGMKQQDVADIVKLDRSRISRRIDAELKNAHKAQK